MNQQTTEAIELLYNLIRVPSISRDESGAADMMELFMKKTGLTYQRKGNNIWTIDPRFDDKRPTLLLNAHIDTVKPVPGWAEDPFNPTEKDGKIYGLGSNDDGASVVCLLQAYRLLIEQPQTYNLIFLASCEEEVSGKNGIEMIIPLLPPITVALVGEPTGMHPAIAEKGLMVLDITSAGKSGHAAREEGINAIYKALPAIEWFKNHRFEKESALLGPVKMSVTIIEAGTQHNVVPDQCHFVVDVRSNECYSNQELLDEIKKNIDCEAKARSTRLNSSHITPDHPLIKQAVSLGKKPFGSPTLSDQALMPFISFKMGPGQSSRSHTANEYIEIKEIEEAIPLYFQLLNGISLNEV